MQATVETNPYVNVTLPQGESELQLAKEPSNNTEGKAGLYEIPLTTSTEGGLSKAAYGEGLVQTADFSFIAANPMYSSTIKKQSSNPLYVTSSDSPDSQPQGASPNPTYEDIDKKEDHTYATIPFDTK